MLRQMLIFLAVLTMTGCRFADAHFIWLVAGEGDNTGQVYVWFGEDADDESPDFLSYVKGVKPHMVTGDNPAVPLPIASLDDAVLVDTREIDDAVVVVTHDLGVMDRGDSVFRLKYYAKAGPPAGDKVWQTAKSADDLRLDIVPSLKDGRIHLHVLFDGKPAADAEVTVGRPADEDFEGKTDAEGVAVIPEADSGLYSVRVRHVETQPGELDGREYPETRHYCTLALTVPDSGSPTAAASLRSLPQPVTSFGAAIVSNGLYMYGGHTGRAHSYSTEEQSNHLTRLDLSTGEWSTISKGPHLQGLAMVTHGGLLYRIGGFTALNAEGEEHDLKSQAAVACFDPDSGVWTDLPALPEPRSSHDAAVVGDTIYVAGGWMMANGDSQWHSTAWKMDLTADKPAWEAIAEPPFRRRALALAAHGDRLYVIGGMQDSGGPTTAVAVYDPSSDKWSVGPQLAQPPEDSDDSESGGSGRRMAGFGASAFATGGSLYVTTVSGDLQRLSSDGSSWEIIASSLTPRFFHRLLPLDSHHLIAVGGANMSIGKFEEVDVIDVREGT